MPDRLEEFVVQSREHLDVVEESLLELEKQPRSAESADHVDRCFRSIHSIKGDAGYLGLQRIRHLAHAMETLLESLAPPVPPVVVEVLLSARDRLAAMIDDPSRSASTDIADLLAQLAAAESSQPPTTIDVDLTTWNAAHPGGISSYVREVADRHSIHDGTLEFSCDSLRTGLPISPVLWSGLRRARAASTPVSSTQKAMAGISRRENFSIDLSTWSPPGTGLVARIGKLSQVLQWDVGQLTLAVGNLRESLPSGSVVWAGACDTSLTHEEFQLQIGSTPQATAQPRSPQPDSHRHRSDAALKSAMQPSVITDKAATLRIQVELLDRMMTLVGELTLVRNQSLRVFADEEGTPRAILQRLNSVTTELQDVTLRARMQPVGNLFNKFPRMVRDLARELGKQVEIELHGREVELDKTILEQLSDPLMHLTRNSVDHGIELPDVRINKGKPPIGKIILSATHEEGQVQIQVQDDGRGLDPLAIRNKAIALRLRTAAELDRLSPRELYSLVLLPGFSTAKEVTEVSGRGVGMDVVKTNIEHLEGTLAIDSHVDVGCSMVIRLPLTLAIIPCLIVTVNNRSFAVPQHDVEEVICLQNNSTNRIEQAFDTEVYRLRGQLLPIIRFSEVLARRRPFTVADKASILSAHATPDSEPGIQYVVVLRVSGRRFGLVVDQVPGKQEIVVKPMHPALKRIGIFSGSTIMDDGGVALITDANGIAEHAQLSFEQRLEIDSPPEIVRDAAQVHRVLLFESGPRERFALPLIQIRRIALIDTKNIERVGDEEYVTVDGVSTRILRLDRVLNVSAIDVDQPIMTLVLPKFVTRPMGLLISKIVDTESLALDLQDHPEQDPGILGSAVVRDRMTLFLEIYRLCERLFGGMKSGMTVAPSNASLGKRVLLIDDTAFFREVVKRYLSAEGYHVATANHGSEALDILASDDQFDLIVSDIEMPVMDGWEFARQARGRGVRIPMLALTSLSGVQYEAKAKECGYDGYETKLDHDRLMQKVGDMLGLAEATP